MDRFRRQPPTASARTLKRRIKWSRDQQELEKKIQAVREFEAQWSKIERDIESQQWPRRRENKKGEKQIIAGLLIAYGLLMAVMVIGKFVL